MNPKVEHLRGDPVGTAAKVDHTQGAAQPARGARGFLKTSPDSTAHFLIRCLAALRPRYTLPPCSLQGSTGTSTPVSDGRLSARSGCPRPACPQRRGTENNEGPGSGCSYQGVHRNKDALRGEGVHGQCSHGRGHRAYEAWSLGCVKKDSEAPSGPQTDQKIRTLSAVGSHTVMADCPMRV